MIATTMTRHRRVGLAVAAALVLSPVRADAAAETGALVLQYPIGARSTAMGYTGVADTHDPDNIYFNPAAAIAIDGVYTSESYQLIIPRFSTDLWFGHVSAGAAHGLGGDGNLKVGFNVTLAKFAWGTSMATTPTGAPIGEYDSNETYFALTAGVSMPVGERVEWAAGAAFKRVKLKYAPAEFTTEPGAEATSGMADVGTVVSTAVEADGWTVRPAVGLALVNLGPDLEFDGFAGGQKDPLPSWFNYGVAVRVDGPAVALGSNRVTTVSNTMTVDGNHGLNEQHPRWGFGYEVTFMEIASVRWGRRIDDHDRDHIEGWGAGIGIPVGPVRARFDYTDHTYVIQEGSYTTSRISSDVFGLSVAWLFE